MTPLWSVPSGRFAGWRNGDALFDAKGKHVGFFVDDVAYANSSGRYIGEIYRDDWIGRKEGVVRSTYVGRVPHAGLAIAPYVNRVGLAMGGWKDVEF